MPLSDDQKALLRLLAQREEGYDDIAALLGLSVTEVRARVKSALSELDSPAAQTTEPPAPPTSSPDPSAPPAAAPEPPAQQPEPSRPRVARGRGSASERSASPGTPSPRQDPRQQRSKLLPGNRRLFELIGGALVVLLLALFATGAIDIGDDGDGDSQDTSAAPIAEADFGRNATQAILTPPEGDDSDARGIALFGRVGKDPVLQVAAEGLEPTGDGESYTIWLYRNPKLVLRLGAVDEINDEGGLAAQLPVPTELLSYVAGGAFRDIYISRTDDAAYAAEIKRAKSAKRLPGYSGETVLSGRIAGPIVRDQNAAGQKGE